MADPNITRRGTVQHSPCIASRPLTGTTEKDRSLIRVTSLPFAPSASYSNRSLTDVEQQFQAQESQQRKRLSRLWINVGYDESHDTVTAGAEALLNKLEKQIAYFSYHEFKPLLNALGFCQPHKDSYVFDVMATSIEILKRSDHRDISIIELLESLCRHYGAECSEDDTTWSACQHALFAIIGLLTMLFKASRAAPSDGTFHLDVLEKQSALRSTLTIDSARRPIAGLLRALGSVLPPLDTQLVGQIHVSNVNYYALLTMARVNIEWVDTLSAHLDFHPLTRTLMLFRCPSFCAFNCLAGEDCAFDHIVQDYYQPQTERAAKQSKTTVWLQRYQREVLLSYRLIFGQHRRSRKLFLNTQRRILNGHNALDPLLGRLCGSNASGLRALPTQMWQQEICNHEGHLMEQDVYNAETDFPMLGQRLLNLQAFSLRAGPNRLQDLWREHRNPTQWYTLWVVILLGSISLVLTIVQTLLSVAQLVVALKQLGPTYTKNLR